MPQERRKRRKKKRKQKENEKEEEERWVPYEEKDMVVGRMTPEKAWEEEMVEERKGIGVNSPDNQGPRM